jgi:hypothetical protein
VAIGAAAACAADLTVNLTLKADKGYLNLTKTAVQNINLTNAAPNFAGGTQLVGTNGVGEAVTLGSVTTNGWGWFGNLSTNYVEVGVQDYTGTNFLPLLRLNSGESQVFRLAPGVAPYARANGAAVRLERYVFDN